MKNQFYYNPRLEKWERGYITTIYMRRGKQNIWMGFVENKDYQQVLTKCNEVCECLNKRFGNKLFIGRHFLSETRKFIMI